MPYRSIPSETKDRIRTLLMKGQSKKEVVAATGVSVTAVNTQAKILAREKVIAADAANLPSPRGELGPDETKESLLARHRRISLELDYVNNDPRKEAALQNELAGIARRLGQINKIRQDAPRPPVRDENVRIPSTEEIEEEKDEWEEEENNVDDGRSLLTSPRKLKAAIRKQSQPIRVSPPSPSMPQPMGTPSIARGEIEALLCAARADVAALERALVIYDRGAVA